MTKVLSQVKLAGVANGLFSGLIWTGYLSIFDKSISMKHITILVPDGQTNLSSVACIVGSYEMFTRANGYWSQTAAGKKNGTKELYKIELAGVSKKAEFDNGLLTVSTHVNISAISKTNLIIIPSLVREYETAIKGNKLLIEWIEQQYKADTFRTLFPKVNLLADQLITDEHGIYTNGGAYSFLNLLLYLVEKYYDRQTAIFCSKIFQIEMDRQSQSAFTIFTGQKSHGDEMVKEAQAYIESNLHEKISAEQLSSIFSVGRRNFDRRFIKATGNTPVEYSQRVKIESAKKAFETSRKTINEVMYEVGYNDVKAFREVFRKITGMSPLEYRNRYNKEAMV